MAKDNGYGFTIDDIKGAARDAGPFDDAVDRLAAQRDADLVAAVRRYAIETHEQYAANLREFAANLVAIDASPEMTRRLICEWADALAEQAKAWRAGKVP